VGAPAALAAPIGATDAGFGADVSETTGSRERIGAAPETGATCTGYAADVSGASFSAAADGFKRTPGVGLLLAGDAGATAGLARIASSLPDMVVASGVVTAVAGCPAAATGLRLGGGSDISAGSTRSLGSSAVIAGLIGKRARIAVAAPVSINPRRSPILDAFPVITGGARICWHFLQAIFP